MTDLEKVNEFHETFSVPFPEAPAIPSIDRVILRIKLLQEELDELEKAALDDQSIVDVADALADLQYILLGTVLEFGLGELFEKVFDIVHESNMSKTCETEEVADKTIDFYKNRDIDTYKEEHGNIWVVKRLSDSKVLKSINYHSAEPLIEKLLQDPN